jgi:hypothetical protein
MICNHFFFFFVIQVSAFMTILATVYMRIFLKESIPNGDGIKQPLLKGAPDVIKNDDDDGLGKTARVFKRIPSVGNLISMMRNR